MQRAATKEDTAAPPRGRPTAARAANTVSSDPPLTDVLAIEVSSEQGRHDAFIHEIARDPRPRTSEGGIGTMLLLAGLAAARELNGHGGGAVQLLVDVGNTDAITWYCKWGLRVITAYTEKNGTEHASEVRRTGHI